MLKTFLLSVVLAGIFVFGYKYEMQIREEKIFLPCRNYPKNFFDAFLTWPDNMTLLPDDTLYISGDIVLLYDFQPKKRYPLTIEFFKRQRGSWQKTIYTIRRDDFCTSLFDPTEPWRPFFKNFPSEQHICPLRKGQIFSVDHVSEQEFKLPSGSLEGDYWVHYTVGNEKNLSEYLCAEFYISLYRA